MKNKAVTKVVNIADIKRAIHKNGPVGTMVAAAAMQLTGLCRINSLYSEFSRYRNRDFTEALLRTFRIGYNLEHCQLDYIPREGPFIIVSNHPFGGADGIILYNVVASIRPDFRLMTNFILSHIPNLKDVFYPVNPFEGGRRSSYKGMKMALEHIQAGGCLGIFPAGEVSTYYNGRKYTADKEWTGSILRFIVRSGVPVVPVYFDGENSRIFHFLGHIHPMLRTLRLPRELLNKSGTTLSMRIGKPIPPEEIHEIDQKGHLAAYLQNRCYAGEGKLRQSPTRTDRSARTSIALPRKKEGMLQEIAELEKDALLFTVSGYKCFLTDYGRIPELIWQLGRRREETFRAVGEGTNTAMDLDTYDRYYKHLILWDENKKDIAGAYRLGIGSEIVGRYGIGGFYSSTLFRYSPELKEALSRSIELGRSFVAPEYQKEALPLMLLIKGLLYSVLKYKECRYLFGPVSITSWYPMFYRSLIIYYLKERHSIPEIGQYIQPYAPFTPDFLRTDPEILLSGKMDSIEKFDHFLMKLSDRQYRMPTLVKKYLKLNASIVDFNIDKDFNYCVDGLVFLDILKIPEQEIRAVSKGHEDQNKVMSRFGYGTGS